MKADGSEQTQMTDDPHWNTWFPHISPDRKKVAMIAYHESDVRPGDHVPNKDVEIRLMTGSDASGWSKPRTLLKLFGGQGTINVNSWAPDSQRFLDCGGDRGSACRWLSYCGNDAPSWRFVARNVRRYEGKVRVGVRY